MIEEIIAYPSNSQVVVSRFICAVFLHFYVSGELTQALNMMNFAQNHIDKFENWKFAFCIGFMQMLIVYTVELVNFAILLNSSTVQDVIMNFLAIVIIVEFDDFLFAVIDDVPMKKLVSDQQVVGLSEYVMKKAK